MTSSRQPRTEGRTDGPAALFGLAATGVVASHTLYLGVLPVMLVDRGLGGLALGLVVGASAAGTLLARLMLMRATAAVRPVALAGVLLLCLSQAGLMTFGIGHETLVLRLMNGLGNGMVFFCLFSALPAGLEQASRRIGLIGAGAAVALLAGSPAGIALQGQAGSAALFATGLACALLGGTACLLIVRQIRPSPPGPDSGGPEAGPRPVAWGLLAAILAVAATLGALEVTMPLVGRGLGTTTTMLAFGLFGAAFILGRLAGGRLATAARGRLAVAGVTGLAALAATGVSLYLSAPGLLVSALVTGLALGLANTFLMSRLIVAVPLQRRAPVLLGGQIASDLGIATGIVLVGAAHDRTGTALFPLVAALCAVAAVLVARAPRVASARNGPGDPAPDVPVPGGPAPDNPAVARPAPAP